MLPICLRDGCGKNLDIEMGCDMCESPFWEGVREGWKEK